MAETKIHLSKAPTRDELLQALQAIVTDTFNIYQALAHDTKRPTISIGQWRRLTKARDLIGLEAETASTGSESDTNLRAAGLAEQEQFNADVAAGLRR